ncbi:MAG: IS1380 family transposase, partial [Actinobacteria bacterium]|nr:IS1380 family transposase [Actinomycetota bacterium]
MQSSHAASAVDVVFDDPNLIADGGLVSVVALAEQVGLPELVSELVTISGAANSAGANPAAKVMSLVAGMVAGADSIEDMDRLRHAGNAVVFDQIRAPSTLGTFLRAFTHGHVQQLNAVLRQTLIGLVERVPLLPGAEQVVFVDLDSTHRQVYGYAKQGAAVGRLKGKKTLHPLLATASTPIAAPVVVAVRMRRGKAADVRGAARFLAEALATVRAIAPTARIVVRADSKFYTADVAATAARYGAAVSLTTGSNPSVNAAITQVPDTAWTPIHYPNAFVDEDTGELVSDAEVAEIPYVAFSSQPKKRQVHGRLIVRRVKRLNPTPRQDGMFDVWRHHAVFLTSPFEMLQAESQHRAHAIVEQVIADAAASALAHLPSGSFPANAAWAVLWAIAHNLTRAAGALAGAFHARATTATVRAHLINVPARLARGARRLTLHLP